MTEREVQFNAEELIGAVEDVRDHVPGTKKLTLRSTHVVMPKAAPQIGPEEIAATRKALKVSQPVFARLLNVPKVTAVSWEKGRRKPSGAALRLLEIAREHPEILLKR